MSRYYFQREVDGSPEVPCFLVAVGCYFRFFLFVLREGLRCSRTEGSPASACSGISFFVCMWLGTESTEFRRSLAGWTCLRPGEEDRDENFLVRKLDFPNDRTRICKRLYFHQQSVSSHSAFFFIESSFGGRQHASHVPVIAHFVPYLSVAIRS